MDGEPIPEQLLDQPPGRRARRVGSSALVEFTVSTTSRGAENAQITHLIN
jgi:hypothetical protein